MPVVRIFSAIAAEDRDRLKKLAEEMRMTEYKLIQEAILVYVNEPNKIKQKKEQVLRMFSTYELLEEIWNRIP